jgi:two-component system, sensor histidine kinase and response regulator
MENQKILVIEDDDLVRKLLSHVLTNEQFLVTIATNGMEGLAKVKNNHFDLVICDVEMPDINGYDVLSRLRNDAQTATIPFIFLSARTSQEDVRYAMGMGADDYLFKPFTKKELLQAVKARFYKNNLILEQEKKRLEELLKIRTDELTKINAELEMRVAMRTAAVQKAYDELDYFIYRAAHDIRGPLTTLLGLMNLMELNSDNVNTYLGLLINHTQRTLKTLTTITSIQDIKKKDLEISSLNLHQLWAKSFMKLGEVNNPNIGTVNIIKDIQFTNDLFLSDEDLVAQLICNLVDNGIRHRTKRAATGNFVKVSLMIEKGMLHITVKDDGMGIAPEAQPRIFDMFYRGSEFTSGSGMGLYIIKMIVEKLNGSITFESAINQGSLFNIILPPIKH